MPAPAPAPPLLDTETIEFIQHRVSIYVAGRSADNVPTSARGWGCKVSGDGRAITIFVPRAQATALLRDVEENQRVAAVFSRPTSHRTVQFKGRDARVAPLAPDDAQTIAAYVGSFLVEVQKIGHSAPFVHAMFAARPDEMAAIVFTPTDGFAQTPGPGAGAPLRAR
ncbi:MAG: pyridoxamine 5'-phosphate oxidase family protein [Rudaea sp.]